MNIFHHGWLSPTVVAAEVLALAALSDSIPFLQKSVSKKGTKDDARRLRASTMTSQNLQFSKI